MRRMMMSGKKVLPIGYTKLNYLQSNGTQYIKTDVIPHNKLTFKTVFSILREDNQMLFGSRTSGTYGDSENQMYLNLFGTRRNVAFFYGTRYDEYSNTSSLNIKYEIKSGQNNLDAFQGGATQPIYIFCLNNIGQPLAYAYCKLYDFVIYNDGEIYKHYVPAQRNSDGVLGLYETVTGTFLTNLGTGEFTGG